MGSTINHISDAPESVGKLNSRGQFFNLQRSVQNRWFYQGKTQAKGVPCGFDDTNSEFLGGSAGLDVLNFGGILKV